MKKYCFGIDVGGTTVKCGLFQIDGTLVDKWEIPTNTEEEGSKILPDIAHTINNKISEKQIDKEEVAGIGLGVPGPVDCDGVVLIAVNLKWGRKDVAKELSDLTGIPVQAGNDANVAALGEMWKGGGEGTKNLILVTLGTGVGGGIIVNGKIISGSHGAGGEIGHAPIALDIEDTCNCGNKGCLELVASATGIVRLANRALNKDQETKTVLREQNLSAKAVFDAYKQDDLMAKAIIEEFAEYLGIALANYTVVVDPEIIVLGGGVSKAGEVLTQVVQKAFDQYAVCFCKGTPIVLAKLGNDAGIYGAARMVLD